MEWQKEAERLFFSLHKKMKDIAAELGISRQALSAHLKTCDGFEQEKQRRKEENAARRKLYQSDWEKANRSMMSNTEKAMLRRQHEIDVAVLSKDRFFEG